MFLITTDVINGVLLLVLFYLIIKFISFKSEITKMKISINMSLTVLAYLIILLGQFLLPYILSI